MLTFTSELRISQEVQKKIIEHLERSRKFTLYHDEQNYGNFYPAELYAEFWAGGILQTEEYFDNQQAFVTRIHLALGAYSNFYSETPRITQLPEARVSVSEHDINEQQTISLPELSELREFPH